MRRRLPVTLVAYLALIGAGLLLGLIERGRDPAFIFAVVLLGALAIGLYVGMRSAWLLSVAFQVLNLVWALTLPAWAGVVVSIVSLGLLLAPPTRRYFRAARPVAEPSRVRRAGRIAAIVVTVMMLAGVAGVTLSAPDPVAGDLSLVRSDRPGKRVLFVGNSLVSDNSMPAMVRRLGEGAPGAEPIFAVRYARRGSELHDARDDDRLTALLDDERWDQVVLQEHSLLIARRTDLEKSARAAAELSRLARGAGADPVLFSNPGYDDGDRDDLDGDTRAAMQARIRQGHRRLAARLSATVAPVGDAWEAALEAQPGVDLYKGDGIRPNRAGSYLTACVLYAILTGRDPRASSFAGGLDAAQARRLQGIAAQAVDAAPA